MLSDYDRRLDDLGEDMLTSDQKMNEISKQIDEITKGMGECNAHLGDVKRSVEDVRSSSTSFGAFRATDITA